MVFKKELTPLTRRGNIHKFASKDGTDAQLPQRAALNSLSGSSGLLNYSKLTPGAGDESTGILDVESPYDR